MLIWPRHSLILYHQRWHRHGLLYKILCLQSDTTDDNAKSFKHGPTSAMQLTLTNAQRAYVCDSILAQQSREYSMIQNAVRQAFKASIERAICQDLRSLMPRASTSSDNIKGEIMRRAETLAKLPEHQEFVKRNSR